MSFSDIASFVGGVASSPGPTSGGIASTGDFIVYPRQQNAAIEIPVNSYVVPALIIGGALVLALLLRGK